MIDGILIVDKEGGITSYDVIRKLKRIVGKGEKIGHAGTLDPFASGLLMILFGKATKLFDTMRGYEKVYEVEGEFGYSTDTQDITGEVVNKDEKKSIPDLDVMRDVIERELLGNILQIPPKYSAKKIKGEKAYDLARKGKEFELRPVEINVSQFEIYEYSFPYFKCKIKCSSGTYVRTLIYDLGIKLGTYAVTKALRRVSIGDFNVNEAVKSTEIREGNLENTLRRVINV